MLLRRAGLTASAGLSCSGLCLVFVVSLSLICLLSCIFQHVPLNVNGTVQPNCAAVPLTICSLTQTRIVTAWLQLVAGDDGKWSIKGIRFCLLQQPG